jgi:hypothetical protein
MVEMAGGYTENYQELSHIHTTPFSVSCVARVFDQEQ